MELLHDTHFWVALSFVIFLAIVWVKGRKAILGSLDGRIDTIRKEIQTAESLKSEAEKLLAEYERKREEAIREARGIVVNAEKNAAEIRKQAQTNLDESMARREKQLQTRIEQMKQSATNEIRQYAADLAIKATQEIISQQLNKETGSRLLDESIKTVSHKFQ
ncbi:MAG: F0F1 ATP synthase subunit B family protein [Alphaproteobacteria bacterium]